MINHWGATLGNPGWNWETIRPYFAKAYTSPPVDKSLTETLGIDGWTGHSSTHGPLQTSFPGDPTHPVRKAWADTFRSNGYYHTQDPFIDGSLGSFTCIATVDPITKERTHSASAYYEPSKSRENLHVITNATVERILFDNERPGGGDKPAKATGVLYSLNGSTQTVTCDKEVIVAAGTLQSPKVLELSGIGNAELLKKHDIEPIVDLPGVGENLFDHLIGTISFEGVDDLETFDGLILDPAVQEQAGKQYAESKSGLLTSMGVYTYAYLPIIEHLKDEGKERLKKLLAAEQPSLSDSRDQARAEAYYKVAEGTLLDPKEATGSYLSFIGPWGGPAEKGSKTLTLCTMLSQPLSRGSVHIRSKDTSAHPIIDPNYLSNPLDLDVYAEHILYLETIARSPPLSNLLKQPPIHRDPDSNVTDLESAKKWIRKNAASMWHLGGSCSSK